eukprot:CAMPEP_0115369278 /NCGR_PEP_ID=MMETSP0270-20121206/106245_1 /TAXON_ID=71861 /ORGANISM="Scrippsiella trochoidea, Strain CCMP3099" /LENGTH=177 /DNA_ID=CAMNT_0002792089 /DNA_START=69 /DNA_END=599 /DNA_ORIENTATION=+
MGSGDGGTVEVSPEAFLPRGYRLRGGSQGPEALVWREEAATGGVRGMGAQPAIMSVLRELRQLQHACQQASMKVPLQAVLARQDELELGGGARLKDGKLVQPSRTVDSEPHKQVGADSGEEAEAQGDEDEQGEEPPRNKAATKQMMWQFAAVLVAALATKLALWISPGDWESEIFGL